HHGWPVRKDFHHGWPVRKDFHHGWPVRKDFHHGWPVRRDFPRAPGRMKWAKKHPWVQEAPQPRKWQSPMPE
ncbi:hypothetical protein, partial [Halothiobacillus sp.]|uniref:hypothetical protein n=1 Tax=Halothiobacillus sp. TaxID=1891311 RepID=UPI002AD2A817